MSYIEDRIKLDPDSWVVMRSTTEEETVDPGDGHGFLIPTTQEMTIEVTLLDGRTLTATAPRMRIEIE